MPARQDIQCVAQYKSEAVSIKKEPHQGIRGIFVGIPDNQQGYEIYSPSSRQVFVSQDVHFDESFASAINLSEKPYGDALATRDPDTVPPHARIRTARFVWGAKFVQHVSIRTIAGLPVPTRPTVSAQFNLQEVGVAI